MPDLVLLDVMLPDESGYDIVRKLRKNPATKKLPVIMVTAKTAEMDMIKGLDEGADDYIKKPFSIMELITRVKALLRRTETEDIKILQVENITLDHERHMVFVDDKPVELTFKEYELLRLLMTNPSVVLSREVIMRHVWGTEFEGESRTVDMHIKTLRQKLGEAGKQNPYRSKCGICDRVRSCYEETNQFTADSDCRYCSDCNHGLYDRYLL